MSGGAGLSACNSMSSGTGELFSPAELLAAFPNPFSDMTEIELTATETNTGEMVITDVMNREILRTPILVSAGSNRITIDLSDKSHGVYLCSLVMRDSIRFARLVKN
jgi:hypothetical protein